jgi:hypothetical protein
MGWTLSDLDFVRVADDAGRMTDRRIPARHAERIFPMNPLDWVLRRGVWRLTCAECGATFEARVWLGGDTSLSRSRELPGYGGRCPSCSTFNTIWDGSPPPQTWGM